MDLTVASLDNVRRQLGNVAEWGEVDQRRVTTELTYGDGSPVTIVVRTRGRNVDLEDEGEAVAKARALGAPRHWLEIAERVVVHDGFNVNRRGVVFVPAFEWRDITLLAQQLGDCAHAVHSALLESATDWAR